MTVYRSAVTCVFIVCDKVWAELGTSGEKTCYSAGAEVSNRFLGLNITNSFRAFS